MMSRSMKATDAMCREHQTPDRTKSTQDPTPLWIPLAVIFIFVPIMLGATVLAGYLFF